MALTAAYLAALKAGIFQLSEIIEIELDSGTVRYGTHRPAIAEVIVPCVETISSLQNKLDKSGWATRGTMSCTLGGRSIIEPLVANNYLKNRRVTRKQGFIVQGFTLADYAVVFSGKLLDWSREKGKLSLTVMDDSYDTHKKLPVQNATKTQYLDYTNCNLVDVIMNMLLTQLGIASARVDSAVFTSERDMWLPSYVVSRVLTEPEAAKEALDELQTIGNLFLLNTGSQISCKVFAPALPTTVVETWTDDVQIIAESFKLDSGYLTNFYNAIEVLFNYTEGGGNSENDFESAVIVHDTDSQTNHGEIKTKTIKSKWLRDLTFSHTSLAGLKPFHVSLNNGAGAGLITYTYDAGGAHTMQWTPPGSTIGAAVKVTKNGKFDLYGADSTKYCRVIITYASLPGTSGSCTVTISTLAGTALATSLANKQLSRYRDPAGTATFRIGVNTGVYNSAFVQPSDMKNITTVDGLEYSEQGWTLEPCMVTMVRPHGQFLDIEVVESKFYRRTCFVAPAGYPDYPRATTAQRKYGFIGDTNNKVASGTVDGYYSF